MFIAMNRFRVLEGKEQSFEEVWRERDSHLSQVPGFKTFSLLKGDSEDGATLYSSHVIWESRQAFEDWTKSEAFRTVHAGAGNTRGMMAGAPKLELFEAVL
ncbi:MAG: antibiotic biosynthesis monooxygenase family protein [Endozoicomonas sp.]